MNFKIEGSTEEPYKIKKGDLLEDNYGGLWLVAGYHATNRDASREMYFFNFTTGNFSLPSDKDIEFQKFKLLNPNYKVILSNGTID